MMRREGRGGGNRMIKGEIRVGNMSCGRVCILGGIVGKMRCREAEGWIIGGKG